MKKTLQAFLLTALIIVTFSSCGKKEEKAEENTESSIAEYTENTKAETPQPDPLERKTTSAAVTEVSTTVSTVSTTVTTSLLSEETTTTVSSENEIQPSTGQSDPLGGGAFTYNEDGAVVFDDPENNDDERLIISAAQALFESACRTQWNFTVGCPYPIDTSNAVSNGYGWDYYLITDSSIKSFSDIENDYFKVFSERYPNEELNMLYLEHNGAVYALNGARGMDVYYSTTKIKSIDSRTEDEIFFTAESYYDGSDFGDEPYSVTNTFSVVIQSDGTWKAGEFTLPY